MAASKKKRTGARAAVVVVLCLVLVCVVAAAVALGLVSRRVKSFAGGASFSLDYQITSTGAQDASLQVMKHHLGGRFISKWGRGCEFLIFARMEICLKS